MSDDEDDDPFEEFEKSIGEREGDPFDDIGDGPETDDGNRDGSRAGPDPTEPVDAERERYDAHDVTPAAHRDELPEGFDRPEGPDPGTGPGEESVDPATGGVADPATDPSEREGDPFAEAERAFERMDVTDLDPDEVWERLADAERRGSVTEIEDRSYAEVSKHSFCEQCEFFSPPPSVGCDHEGTEILEFVDMESVRVVDCPVVAERERLQQE
jgi:hypothetical protein